MPNYIINTDNLAARPSPDTAQELLENALFNTLYGYRLTYNSTDLNDAIADFLAATTEGRTTPMVKQIRVHAAGLLAAGVAAPGGKLVAANQAHVDNLTAAAGITAGQIGGLTLSAVDGTRWPINTPARANTLLTAMTARIAAVNGVRDTAITAYQALTAQQKKDFQFSTIVWP